MLTCIACSKQLAGGAPRLHEPPEDEDAVVAGGASGSATPSTRRAIKTLTAQIKDMALKASGAYRHCKPCAGSSSAASRHHPSHHRGAYADSEVASGSERFHYAYRRPGNSAASTPRLRSGGAMSSGDEEGEEETTAGGSEDDDAKEWVAQVEPGVLITFLSLPQGWNDLKRIRFRTVDGQISASTQLAVKLMMAVRCSTNGKHKDGGLKITKKSWSSTMFRGLTSKLFHSLVLQSLNMIAPRRIAQRRRHLTMSIYPTLSTDH